MPALISTWLWGVCGAIIFRGSADLFDFGPSDLTAAVFPLAGILTVVYPAALMLSRRSVGTAPRLLIMITAGIIGGFVWGLIVFGLIAGHLDVSRDARLLAFQFGSLLGAITTVVWVALNYDQILRVPNA